MKRPSLLSALSRRPLCGDGAMGTALLAEGLAGGESGMLWNLEKPAAVRAIHASYRRAGSDLITTNSFGGSTLALDLHGLAGRVRDLNQAAAELAREAAGADAWVLGDVGPSGAFLEPTGDLTREALAAAYRPQIEALLAGGVDALLLETMSDPVEATVAAGVSRDAAREVPVIITYAFQPGRAGEFRTLMGTSVQTAIHAALAAGADIVGANCGTAISLDDHVELARQIVSFARGVPVMIQPNAGAPRLEGDRTVYEATPEAMAATAAALVAAGVRIVGGCCGTRPAHLEAIARVLHRPAPP